MTEKEQLRLQISALSDQCLESLRTLRGEIMAIALRGVQTDREKVIAKRVCGYLTSEFFLTDAVFEEPDIGGKPL